MGKDSMNIVTIKAKAQLAAKEIEYAAGESISCDIASIIESCFTPDPANEANKDLLEALKALKACVAKAMFIGCTEIRDEAQRILDKYPNLK